MSNNDNKENKGSLPYFVWPAEALRQLERQGAQALGITPYRLMQRAGAAAFTLARTLWPQALRWLIICGPGNNGGDGYVVASLAQEAGLNVTLLAPAGKRSLPPEATQARAAFLAAGGTVYDAPMAVADNTALIIDAMLGNGISRPPQAPYDRLIEAVNSHPAPVLALDLPSGLMASNGATPGAVINATHTLAFVALKPGLLTGNARDVVGHLHYHGLGLEKWLSQQRAPIRRLDASLLPCWLKPRRPCAHKGEHGRLLVIGGELGTAGAVRMAAEAALRSGAGLVRVLTRRQNREPLLAACSELMVDELSDKTLKEGLSWADMIVIGPGIGRQAWAGNALKKVEMTDKPALWDADALNLLAINPGKRQNRIITPHPGEAARLLGTTTADIERDRVGAVQRLVERYGGVAVLKGAGTLICDQDGHLAIADVGNAGMATGGMGDVLSGIIGALSAQKLALFDAACCGCVVHGAAADAVADERGMRGMLATDLFSKLGRFVNPELNIKQYE